MLTRQFSKCSVAVKLQLFKTFCLCFYDIGLRYNFKSGAFAKLQSAYVKCVKIFLDIVSFYRAMVCIRGTSHGPVSVCLSVTSRSSTKTAEQIGLVFGM